MCRVHLFWLLAASWAVALEPAGPENSRVVEFEPDRGWVFAPSRRPWMVPRDSSSTLKEWDGTKWIIHDIPPDVRYAVGMHVDADGRIWLNTELAPVYVFDPRANVWHTFANMEEALMAEREKGVRFLHDHQWSLAPQYSADHTRIAYRWQALEVCYFDGTAWRKWGRRKITGVSGGDNSVGAPWFDEQGKLCVDLSNHTTWRLDDSGNWSEISYVGHFPEDHWNGNRDREKDPVLPEGCVTSRPDSIAIDNLGVTWLTWKGELYKCIPGYCVKVLAAEEGDWFRERGQLREVFVDDEGNAFVQRSTSRANWMLIRHRSNFSLPLTRIVVKSTGDDSVVAKFDARATRPAVYRWQLDEGPWKLTRADSLALEDLLHGPHLLKVTAIDDQLNMETSPATAAFDIQVDADQQMKRLLAQLSDPDYAKRGRALEALARQPAVALPALRKASETADEERRWWIEAAIQECERQMASQRSGP